MNRRTLSGLAVCGIAALSACLALVHFPDVTPDKLLTAVFGGFFIGAGIGLAMRGGAVLDGTEVAALLVSKRSSLLRVGDVILRIDDRVATKTSARDLFGKGRVSQTPVRILRDGREGDIMVAGVPA